MTRFAAPLLMLLLTALAASDPALAKLPDIKRISTDRIDSQCIGDVSTPTCTVETWIACEALLRSDLCAAAGLSGMRFDGYARFRIMEFDIIAIVPVRRDWYPDTKRGPRVGDMEVRAMVRWCFGREPCRTFRNIGFSPYIYFVRRSEAKWRIVAWTNDESETCDSTHPSNEMCNLFIENQEHPWLENDDLHRRFDDCVAHLGLLDVAAGYRTTCESFEDAPNPPPTPTRSNQ